MMKTLSAIAVHLVIWLNIFLMSGYLAFASGYSFRTEPEMIGDLVIMGDHNYVYQILFKVHLILMLPLLVLVLAPQIKNSLRSSLVSVLSILLPLAIFSVSLLAKYKIQTVNVGKDIYKERYLVETIMYDQAASIILASLLIYQIYMFTVGLKRTEQPMLK